MDLNTLFATSGQSLWLDYIRRKMLTGGELERLIKEDGIRGLTSNPTIFQKAIGDSTDYDEDLRSFGADPNLSSGALYERLALADIQAAADLLQATYRESQCSDGYACLEVSPHLAFDTAGTLIEARRLWREVARDNVMIKVPGTEQGLPAIRQLVGEGININITLIFSRQICRKVFEAYCDGLEARAKKGGNLGRVASVASMFVSRIDAAVDPLIEASAPEASEPADTRALRMGLLGKVAIANAKLAYQDWKQAVSEERFQRLVQQGAQPQRLLWASTGTKDPRFRDTLYVEELLGKHTVNTVPPATLEAFRDHGVAQPRLESGVEEAEQTLKALSGAGIDLESIAAHLVEAGVKQFADAFTKLLSVVDHKRQQLSSDSKGVGTRPTNAARVSTRGDEPKQRAPGESRHRNS